MCRCATGCARVRRPGSCSQGLSQRPSMHNVWREQGTWSRRAFPHTFPLPSSCHASRLDSASSSEPDSCIPPRPAHSIGEATPSVRPLHRGRPCTLHAHKQSLSCSPFSNPLPTFVQPLPRSFWASPRFLLQQFPSHFHPTTLPPYHHTSIITSSRHHITNSRLHHEG